MVSEGVKKKKKNLPKNRPKTKLQNHLLSNTFPEKDKKHEIIAFKLEVQVLEERRTLDLRMVNWSSTMNIEIP